MNTPQSAVVCEVIGAGVARFDDGLRIVITIQGATWTKTIAINAENAQYLLQKMPEFLAII